MEPKLLKHPEAQPGESEPCRMLGIVLSVVVGVGICFALVAPFVFRAEVRADELKRFDVTDRGKIMRISHWISCVAVWFEDGTTEVYRNPERVTVEAKGGDPILPHSA